jgi:hypothetical protein
MKRSDETYLKEIQNIRDARDNRMATNPHSWLALIGLFRLEEGDNTFGAGGTNMIKLPEYPQENGGIFQKIKGKVHLLPHPDSVITINKNPPGMDFLHTDQDVEPDRIEIGTLTMMIIQRGEFMYLRVWDRASLAAKTFKGLRYFPVDPKYRIKSKFITYDPPRPIMIMDVIGIEHEGSLFGEAQFTWDGVDCSLVAEEDGDELLFSFTDKTRESLTYPGGRYLVTKKPVDGYVILDFNQAINWPCAYTSFATCPLPPKENRLQVCIEAGEMRYHE